MQMNTFDLFYYYKWWSPSPIQLIIINKLRKNLFNSSDVNKVWKNKEVENKNKFKYKNLKTDIGIGFFVFCPITLNLLASY